jgi:signal-transduction protein with cAMP-binding, CBS, and nucleotidyltransferase domain
MHDVAEFLKAHEPFGALDETDLDRLAERAKIEFLTRGRSSLGRVSLLRTRSGSFVREPWS